MNEMLFLLSPEGKIIRTNRKSREVLGYEESKLVGRLVGVVMSDEPACRGLIDRIKKERSVQNIKILLRTKPGERIPAIFSGSMIEDRKRLEEELRAHSL